MLVGVKNVTKLIGISIIAACAVFVCTMFINYYLDVIGIKDLIVTEEQTMYYDAFLSTSKVVCLLAGGCLLVTTIIMLLFYIKQYIDTHKKDLGILKALGYNNLKIAKHFWVFGLSVLAGTLLGYLGAFIMFPEFYRLQNIDHVIPEVSIHFHPSLLLFMVILPTLFYALIAIGYASLKLRQPVLSLLKENLFTYKKVKKTKIDKKNTDSFIVDLRKTNLRSKKTLVFFIIFSSFCFASMFQMSMKMEELSSKTMGVMIMIIGIILAGITLLLSIITVIDGNKKTIAMMRVLGYSQKECADGILNGYRPIAYIGFAIGTIYQYGLLEVMVNIVYKDFPDIPTYKFDFGMMFICLLIFIVIYELIMNVYSRKINRIPLKTIMIE